MSLSPAIVVTFQDFARLQDAINAAVGLDTECLDAELERARLVESKDVSPLVVTMNTRLIYEDLASKRSQTIQLVYPDDADASQHKISILAPLGSALLGLEEGATIDWAMPGGTRRIKLLKILYQPEAAGDWEL
ncbi:MAG TPA: nucleoside diphosphate kinase regulator [Polyangiaceae bacterium]|nr:nucleoside diphosphate kinase regulator [Polyangiaceae bacterium]